MKFSVSKDKLLEGLSTVQNVVSTRTTLPILSNVLLQASDGEIRLTTTDLDVGVRGSIEAQVERTGATTLPARRLFAIVRELPASEIYFDVDSKNFASIRSGSSFFKILGLPEEEFPPLARFDEAKEFTIGQKELKDGLKKTSYAISTDETRYVLNGILFSFKDNKLTLVATDGRRLALVDLELEFPRSQELDIIVPTKAVAELQRLVREEGEVKLSIGENQIAFELNRTLLVSKLIEGNYPNYRQVIPAEAKERITLGKGDVFNRGSPRLAARQRKVQFRQTHFFEKQHRHRGDYAGCRRGQGIVGGHVQGARILDCFQSGVSHGAAAKPAERRDLPRSHRRNESRRHQNSRPVPLRPDADAAQLRRGTALS